ncbi:MAG: acylneuraminate cytidylyltransferase family protein [Anaerolineae bacterium]|nr:acylneuraminate cytidylyltransferase family protein [Anaerolineae bacterium]
MKPEILALIPARSGSKTIKDKNIRPLAGKPMLAYSIEHALASRLVTRTVVSTDSARYAAIARQYGAETPFLRPAEYAQDHSTDLDVFRHALIWLKEQEGYIPDLCVHLRPTHPVRDPAHIDAMIRILLDNPQVDSVRSVAPAPETPFKMWFRDENGRLSPVVVTADIPEAYNMPRQQLPATYMQNASIDVVRTQVITGQQSMTGHVIYGYVMDENFDIDTEEQLQTAAAGLATRSTRPVPQARYCFDIDGVIATLVPSLQYDQAKPRHDTIRLINHLYDAGAYIILFTARGSASGIDWSEETRRQMQEWGVKHHELRFGKPAADYYIDDKMIGLEKLAQLFFDRATGEA